MARKFELIVFPAKDVEAAKNFFNSLLGTEPYVDQPYYVGYRVDGQEIGLDPNAEGDAPISYVESGDVKADLEALKGAGAQVVSEPREVGGGLLVAQVKDASGNVVGLRQPPK
jgi:predicted enzyme related to lactoylglutathione lyase